jgi:phospholipase C
MKLIIKSLLFLLFVSAVSFAQFPPQLRNVVLIIQENRTPDNLFHFLTPACSIPAAATGYNACIPSPVTTSCYDVSPCGLSNQSGTVVPVTLTGVPLSGSADPNHNHAAFEQMCDPDSTFKCRNDGAWQMGANSLAYGYVQNPLVTNYDGSTGHLLDPYLTFAKQYGWANFMYQTNQGPSYPAHQFLFSGTSALTNANDKFSIFVSENFGNAIEAGCLLPSYVGTAHVWGRVIQPTNPAVTCSPLYDNNSVEECTIYNSLNAKNVGSFCGTHNNMATTVLDPHSISWKYYAPTTTNSTGYLWTAPNAIQSICNPQPNGSGGLECTGAEWTTHVDVQNNGTDILRDIASCSLAQVSWVIPDGAWSDHAAQNDQYGPSWVAAVINAIGNNPTCPAGTPDAGQTYWNNTAIVVTWDDWGGWSDNQPASVLGGLPCVFTTPPTPCPGDYQYGFRVPLLIVSAYTPQGFIHNSPHDFGSILRMIEGINHLQEGMMLNADVRSISDLHAFFTLKQPRPYQTVPAVMDANFFLTYTGAVTAPDNE